MANNKNGWIAEDVYGIYDRERGDECNWLCEPCSATFEEMKLMAAAPEMLAALESLLSQKGDGHIDHGTYSEEVTGECTDECRAVQAAIKKAKGEI